MKLQLKLRLIEKNKRFKVLFKLFFCEGGGGVL